MPFTYRPLTDEQVQDLAWEHATCDEAGVSCGENCLQLRLVIRTYLLARIKSIIIDVANQRVGQEQGELIIPEAPWAVPPVTDPPINTLDELRRLVRAGRPAPYRPISVYTCTVCGFTSMDENEDHECRDSWTF